MIYIGYRLFPYEYLYLYDIRVTQSIWGGIMHAGTWEFEVS